MPRRSWRALALAAAMLAGPAAAVAATGCPPLPPLPAPSRIPRCAFSDSRMAYAGAPHDQALCLLPQGDPRSFTTRRALGAPLDDLVGALATLDRGRLLALLRASGIAYSQAELTAELSHADGGLRQAPAARYFVIHDTSGPATRRRFPSEGDPRLNQLGYQYCGGGWTAHAFINRRGAVLLAYDFSEPWRATKFESANADRKGLFLHIELNQPRRPRRGETLEDATITPDPPFTEAQYRSLALLYAAASVRAGHWLVPAFHSAIDYAWDDDHDDPRGFDLSRFDRALARILRQLGANDR